jgi:hypothetical protein
MTLSFALIFSNRAFLEDHHLCKELVYRQISDLCTQLVKLYPPMIGRNGCRYSHFLICLCSLFGMDVT